MRIRFKAIYKIKFLDIGSAFLSLISSGMIALRIWRWMWQWIRVRWPCRPFHASFIGVTNSYVHDSRQPLQSPFETGSTTIDLRRPNRNRTADGFWFFEIRGFSKFFDFPRRSQHHSQHPFVSIWGERTVLRRFLCFHFVSHPLWSKRWRHLKLCKNYWANYPVWIVQKRSGAMLPQRCRMMMGTCGSIWAVTIGCPSPHHSHQSRRLFLSMRRTTLTMIYQILETIAMQPRERSDVPKDKLAKVVAVAIVPSRTFWEVGSKIRIRSRRKGP